MNLNLLTAIVSLISMLAFVATAVLVALELKHLNKSRYLQISSELYSTWLSREFMESQLWLIHRLQETSWADFIAAHRADYGEEAFHRVGSFYDRVGALVRLGLIEEKEILSTIGPYAIAVWRKIQPLAEEARRLENSTLFADFERIVPACYECYVPNLSSGAQVTPFEPAGPKPHAAEPPRITVKELNARLNRRERITLLDVRRTAAEGKDETTLPGALVLHPDTIPERLGEIPSGGEVVAFCS